MADCSAKGSPGVCWRVPRAPRPPDLIVGIETNTQGCDPDPRWEQNELVLIASSTTKNNRGVELYKHTLSPWRTDLMFASTAGDALLEKVFTPDTHFCSSAFKKRDKAIPRTSDILYRQFCRVVGLKGLSELVCTP